jgi:hypothetical protein
MYLWVALSLLIVSQGTLVLCSSYWHLQKDRDSVSVVSPFLPLMVPSDVYNRIITRADFYLIPPRSVMTNGTLFQSRLRSESHR